MTLPPSPHKIVIVGAGAGGLELACRLGRRHGPAHITLIDGDAFHVWKPSLHEVAAGTLDIHQEGLSYPLLAHLANFSFVAGSVQQIDRESHTLQIGPMHAPDGSEVLPPRALRYDTLVLAVGSVSNFFGTPGAEEHAVTLDTTGAAEMFRLELLKRMVQVDQAKATNPEARLSLAIVGGGATGVELAAELHEAGRLVGAYGLSHFDPATDLVITLVEGGPRLLGPLPERVSNNARAALALRGIQVETDCKVAEVAADHIVTADGRTLPADLCVWAAGIKAPGLGATLDLPLNKLGQLQVDAGMRSPDRDVFAIGDCAATPMAGSDRTLPATAQVAHQQASYLADVMGDRIRGMETARPPFVYRDRGSLVSLGQQSGIGSLMGVLSGRNFVVSGLVARLMYMSLHLLHHNTVMGFGRTATLALARLLLRRSRPRVKLH